MPSFKTWDGLKKSINSKISKSLETEVYEEIRSVMQSHIDSDVYNAYSPKVYKRRGYDDGLIADKNIQKTIPDGTSLLIENNAPFNGENASGKTLDEVIETGDGYTFSSPVDGLPRPFVQNTFEDLEQNKQHLTAFCRGLGYKDISVGI